MSKNQVPEVSRDEQLEELRRALLGNKAFGRARGLLGQSVKDLFETCLTGAPSRRHVVEGWNRKTTDLGIMLSLLARFERDKKTIAAAELRRALELSGYMITGETVPFEKTSPYTVFMIDPELTFGMIDLTHTWDEFDTEDTVVKLRDEKFTQGRFPKPLCDLIAQVNWEEAITLSKDPHNTGLVPRIWFKLIELFNARLKETPTCQLDCWTANLCDQDRFDTNGDAAFFTNLLGGDYRRISNRSRAFGVPHEQSQVLAAFNRKDQGRIASWQFRLPTAMGFEEPRKRFEPGKRFAVCFHPEAEHTRWLKERPQFSSCGVSQGFGAMILPGEDFDHIKKEGEIFLFTYYGFRNSL